ncbi:MULTISPECIES: xylose isomerase [Sphaerochaeta]|jgi:xylose isomerase|uniref:Xylose isomerase n=1 Tax=Sphaerochaeta associata TaxID=1129264 RepID=A0ABY4DF80_9SPIR|nr:MULTISPECIES: xylose isomerase [Sphaerochaeta]MDT3358052.1 xylose isomerase [Spirochaetota bacterium]NLA98655.1 xylose isomerase [Spirochaetales bacterium]MDD2395032.1 xylose isomerase [Sphaerochaeta sp.]MDD3424730.1 xylose isomerase [Sphaerochaeta sp.]MDD3457231.1 xylose isomerase [Sphaerochaeta sp.]
MQYFVGEQEYFKGIGKIEFEGKGSKNPLAFKYYDAKKKIAGKTMEEHLRFATAYWHSFCADGTDPFGNSTIDFPFRKADKYANAIAKADAAFEFFTKLGTPFYCFHDIDASPDYEAVSEYEKTYHKIADELLVRQKASGIKLLWNTANVFSHPNYMNGAATNPDFNVVARAAVQVKNSLDVNVKLGGANYVFWGGREGYMSLLNTDMKREQEHLARFLTMARDYGRSIGFKGTFLIEPKPMEPTKHQYDYDAATTIGFLKNWGLEHDFKCNIEANHATLAGHTFSHDLQVCADHGMLGSVDANQGDSINGWDTDEFPTNIYETTQAMLVILRNGGLGNGGLNFDAKRRRNSTDLEDLFIAHIGGMDSFALGLEVAGKILEDGVIDSFVKERYSSFDQGEGKKFEDGKLGLAELAELGRSAKIEKKSGKQEYLNNLLNSYLFG